ncbi:pyridoxamine 5'-phosphate oxidase family protein [Candidatus Enterococcus ikei]|uniref:Pyridoxamine 5'-phosphate oxidase family protein n=1 Tax=Candidatus Enterococcus ikei TaxID=2815326 RepID=A0ABS3GWW8_9ENTE|nr:pyridoxamine 5'-phosphate oxidase family protein [Enterococcus sp. DIV0869a]MBO0439310.1 pyridoxamine 5'-phosphate oxidase family protein [Enterococcus sp. DIV0869a]
MNTTEVFKKIMKEQTEIALATSVKEIPNVRIVNFFYDETKKCLFFSTFKGNEKITEFQKNPNVAFTTIPTEQTNHVRVHEAKVKKSELTVYDVAEQWIQKIPSYVENIKQAGAMLELYEIHFTKAIVILGMASRETILL